jgi:hypothetical protein
VDESPARGESTFVGSTAPRDQKSAWSIPQEARLRILIDAGYSAGATAGILNAEFGTRRSRNSVIGKCNRLNLTLQSAGRADQYPKAPRKRPALEMYNDVHTSNGATVKTPSGNLITLAELRLELCRYPLGNSPFMFCGAPVVRAGSSWCEMHYHICVVPVKFYGEKR